MRHRIPDDGITREAIFQGAPKRGTYWFERMKNDDGKDAILRGVKGIVGGS